MAKDFPQEALFPQKTIFRKGAASELGSECRPFGGRGLIIHGTSLERNGRLEKILAGFPSDTRAWTFCRAGGEPDLGEITQAIEKAKSIDAEWICGIGGGSVLDLAKAAAGLFNAGEKPVFYQEGGMLEEKGIPFIACPTTAGTGSEAAINAVIINSVRKTKLSIRDKSFIARTVILDVELLKGMPPLSMAYAALDALAQAYESYTSRHAAWFTESLALKAIDMINKNVIPACESAGEDNLASLLLASYLCGIAFSSSRLGVIHGLAHPLGTLYNLPHGLVSSVLLVPSIKLNKPFMGEKYRLISGLLGADFIRRAEALLSALGISPPFKGKPLRDEELIIDETLKSGSTAASPKDITRADVEFLLGEIF